VARNSDVTLSSDDFSFSIKMKVEPLIEPDCKTHINSVKFIKRGHYSKNVLRRNVCPKFIPLKTQSNLNFSERFSPYRAVNTLRLGYIKQPVNAVQGKIIAVCSGILTYSLTPWSRVLLEKLTGFAAGQVIPRIYGTRKFITILTSARHLFLS
jgi:hypothetical protein